MITPVYGMNLSLSPMPYETSISVNALYGYVNLDTVMIITLTGAMLLVLGRSINLKTVYHFTGFACEIFACLLFFASFLCWDSFTYSADALLPIQMYTPGCIDLLLPKAGSLGMLIVVTAVITYDAVYHDVFMSAKKCLKKGDNE